ncbi:hypothetical protein [Micromonospora chalcea]|uniref:hypothetical protein n=1 Tax=Micromonospora chalcea TaxID=1874 RepID=UPI003332D04A
MIAVKETVTVPPLLNRPPPFLPARLSDRLDLMPSLPWSEPKISTIPASWCFSFLS